MKTSIIGVCLWAILLSAAGYVPSGLMSTDTDYGESTFGTSTGDLLTEGFLGATTGTPSGLCTTFATVTASVTDPWSLTPTTGVTPTTTDTEIPPSVVSDLTGEDYEGTATGTGSVTFTEPFLTSETATGAGYAVNTGSQIDRCIESVDLMPTTSTYPSTSPEFTSTAPSTPTYPTSSTPKRTLPILPRRVTTKRPASKVDKQKNKTEGVVQMKPVVDVAKDEKDLKELGAVLDHDEETIDDIDNEILHHAESNNLEVAVAYRIHGKRVKRQTRKPQRRTRTQKHKSKTLSRCPSKQLKRMSQPTLKKRSQRRHKPLKENHPHQRQLKDFASKIRRRKQINRSQNIPQRLRKQTRRTK